MSDLTTNLFAGIPAPPGPCGSPATTEDAADATDSNQMQHFQKPFTAEAASDAAECNELQHAADESDPDLVSDAAESNELQHATGESDSGLATDAAECNGLQHAADEFDPDLVSDAAECNGLQHAADESDPGLASDADPAVLNATDGSHARKCKDLQGFENRFSPPPEDQATKCNDLERLESPAGEAACTADAEDDSDEPDELERLDGVDAAVDELLDRLSDRQRAAVELLLHGESDVNVAEKLEVNPCTVWRWKQQPDFRRSLKLLREILYGSSMERLHGLVPQAVDVLQKDLQRGHAGSAIRLIRLLGIKGQL